MDKKICWGIKMAMTNTGEEAFDVSLEAVRYYSGIMMAGLSEIGVVITDLIFAAVAAAKIAEMYYNDLDSESKELFSMLMNDIGVTSDTRKKVVEYDSNGEVAPDESPSSL